MKTSSTMFAFCLTLWLTGCDSTLPTPADPPVQSSPAPTFDYALVSGDIETAIADLDSIIAAANQERSDPTDTDSDADNEHEGEDHDADEHEHEDGDGDGHDHDAKPHAKSFPGAIAELKRIVKSIETTLTVEKTVTFDSDLHQVPGICDALPRLAEEAGLDEEVVGKVKAAADQVFEAVVQIHDAVHTH